MYSLNVIFNSLSGKYVEEKYNFLPSEPLIFILRVTAENNKFFYYTRVETLIVATIYLQLIQNKYMFRSFAVLQCSHQHCVQPVASDVEVVGYL